MSIVGVMLAEDIMQGVVQWVMSFRVERNKPKGEQGLC